MYTGAGFGFGVRVWWSAVWVAVILTDKLEEGGTLMACNLVMYVLCMFT